jgi:hypothetical protein
MAPSIASLAPTDPGYDRKVPTVVGWLRSVMSLTTMWLLPRSVTNARRRLEGALHWPDREAGLGRALELGVGVGFGAADVEAVG